jgi:hypothetical protein
VEFFDFSLVFDNKHGLVISSGFNLERPEFDIFLDERFSELSSNKSFGIKNGVDGVSGDLILSSVSNVSFGVSESDV